MAAIVAAIHDMLPIAARARRETRPLSELVLALQCLDKGFLGKILRVRDVAHNAVDQQEYPAHVIGHKARLRLRGQNGVKSGCARRIAHSVFQHLALHGFLPR